MNSCLRCSKPCEATSLFCEACKSQLQRQLWETRNAHAEDSLSVPPLVAISSENNSTSDTPLERITGPQPIVVAPQLPQTPQPLPPRSPELPPVPSSMPRRENVAEHAVYQLNEAAQRIAHAEPGNRRLPRASRLSPLRDISADIQRHSTPLPKVQSPKVPQSEQGEDLGRRMPDLWPWLQNVEPEENEKDQWSGRTDPLLARHFPNSAEVAQIEAEDVRRAMAEGLVTTPLMPRRLVPQRKRLHLAFALLAILAVIALAMDGGLVFVAFLHSHHTQNISNGPPSLTLSSNAARIGQTVMLHIQHFSSNTDVYLTHDIQETVKLTSGSSSLVKVGADGSTDLTMLVDASWTPGYHTIEAEDVATRYTASATLQITGAGPTQPSRLFIDASSLDLGADYQGANTIQPLTLHNSGGGSISWSASSNQPWLLLSPSQGMFSDHQTIAVAVERANLKPGDYKGTITFSSNVSATIRVPVQMSVRPLPNNAGPVLEVTPPLLSFTALDGEANPPSQVLMINNPGSQRLNWSITSNNPILNSQAFLLFAFGTQSNWLSTDQTAGVVVPHGTGELSVMVNSQNLLPGVYTAALVIGGGQGTINNPQSVNVSLTIQPRCGLTLSTGSMSFTTVEGQINPSNQPLTIGATSSCSGAINWKATSASNWLTVTPASGQLKGAGNTVTSVGVNASGLKPGTYISNLAFTSPQSTQTVMVTLIIQAPPPPSEPIMGATPLSLNFSTTQGMPSPPGQVVTITNTGGGALTWHTQVNIQASGWLGAGPTGGTIAAHQTGQVTVYINTAGLTPNTYVGQIVLLGTDASGATASGSPQTISVNLLVLPPCALQQPSSSSVAFSATQGMGNPSSQMVSIVASGNCAWPLSWQATKLVRAPWLQLSPSSGTLAASGQPTSINLNVNISRLNVGTYSTTVSIAASDGPNSVQGSPQSFMVTVTILPPCVLSVVPLTLPFSVAQGQPAPPAQSFSLSESGNCALPVTWTATGDSGSSSWLTIGPPTSGTGSATVSVNVNPTGLVPGTYAGKITVTAVGNGGAVVLNSPQTVNVSLLVTGYSLSGTVIACSDSNCTTSKPLPGAALTLVNSSTNQSINATADSSGNYSFSNLALGAYTLTATGTDGTYNYLGTASLNITGNQSNYNIDTFPH